MTTKKNSTKTDGRKASTPTELRRQLARDLAAVLSNPQTPVSLFNSIADELSDMSSAIDYHAPEMVDRSLAAYEQKEAERKGGR